MKNVIRNPEAEIQEDEGVKNRMKKSFLEKDEIQGAESSKGRMKKAILKGRNRRGLKTHEKIPHSMVVAITDGF